jgi:hypothetical protein
MGSSARPSVGRVLGPTFQSRQPELRRAGRDLQGRRRDAAYAAEQFEVRLPVPPFGEQQDDLTFGGTHPWEGRAGVEAWCTRLLAPHDRIGRALSYPQRMPDIPELVAAIDNRLADIAAEVSALGAAKAQLAAPRVGGHAPAVTTDAQARRSPG